MMPGKPQVAVFDTAFHATMPREAFLYAIPYSLYTERQVRVYGFHGTSHRYVTHRAARMLAVPVRSVDLVTLHLGNGCSAAAVRNGRSVDTSMGMTPLQGLVMGTRCGDLDAGLFYFLSEWLQMSAAEVYEMLNRQSGLLGLSGVSNDVREILKATSAGNERAQVALDVFAYRVRKYIGAYLAVLGRAHAIVFTAGIGENCPELRRRACAGLEPLGIVLDQERNDNAVGKEAVISADGSPIAVLVIPTDEELQIAIETFAVVQGEKQQ
jgi:acetate kinase